MKYKDWINALEDEFVGKKVKYEGDVYRIEKVDYNGFIHINKASEHNNTTAVYEPHQARQFLVQE